jgi:hypothetical protein
MDLPARPDDVPPVRLLLACGAAGGAHVADWTTRNARVFTFRAK